MIRIHRGRGGSVTRTAGVMRVAVAALLCFSLGAAGCSSKKAQGVDDLKGGAPVGDSGMKQKSTIEDYSNNGQIGGGPGGPLTDIHFGYNDYTVQPQDSSILRTNANWLQAHPDSKVQVEGNCDERGSEEYNIALGAKRAQSAKDYLTTLGISPGRISTISYGKELPLCHEQDEGCWAQNRRDHFVVSGNQANK
jgi:peptidoglycan-associated lipoprotein